MRKRKRKIVVGKKKPAAFRPSVEVLNVRLELKNILKKAGVDVDLDIKYKNGDFVFNSDTQSELDLSYQIIEIYKSQKGIQRFKSSLKNHLDDFNDFYWSLLAFDNVRYVRNEEENSYFNLGSVQEGSIECKKSSCSSTRIRVSLLGTTSGDEGFRIRFVCAKCNHRWSE